MPNDINAILFGNSPQPIAENRPGLDRRQSFRTIAQSGLVQQDRQQDSLLTPADTARAALILRQFSALLDNSRITTSRPAWDAPSLWSTPIDLSAQIVLPAAAGSYIPAITFSVSPGRWARISGYGVDVDGGFLYDGSILWRITKNGVNVETLADWAQHRGSVIQPRDTFILGDGNTAGGDTFQFEVRRAVTAGAPSTVNMALVGWTWRPRNNYEGTRSGMTAF